MELHSLSNGSAVKKARKRVGRGHGSGNGKTAGRGHKGQKSRSGYTRKLGFEGGQMPLNRRLPKRGFHHENRHPLAEVNLDVLADKFEDGEIVSTDTLQERGIVRVLSGGVKLLGRGEPGKKLTIRVQAASAGAREKVEKAGGTLEIIPFAGAAAPVAAAE